MKTRGRIGFVLSLILVFSLILSHAALLLVGSLPLSDGQAEREEADVWDGETVTIGWYTEHSEEDTYTLTKASDLAGLSYLVAHRSESIYYEEATGKVDPTVKSAKEGFVELKKGSVSYLSYGNVAILSFPGKTIQLGADLDMAGKPFTPIGASASFGGNFDGAGHTVKNLTVDNDRARHSGGSLYFGMFGAVAWGGSVSNLTIENEVLAIGSDIGNNAWVGAGGVLALVHGTGGATISDVTVKGLTVTVDTPENNPRNNRIELGGIAGQIQFKGEKIGKNVKVLCMTVTSTWEDGNILTGSAGKYYGHSSSDKDAAFADCSVTKGHGEGVWVNTDESQHWKACSICGRELEGTRAAHNPTEWKQTDDSAKHYQVCECGYQTAAVAHDALSYEDNGDGNTHKVTCGTCSQEVNAEEAHDWKWDPVPGEAKEKATCTKCGAEGETRDTHEHKPVKHDAKAPTCTEDGNPEYYTCEGEGDVCDGKYYKDATCTTEYTAEEIVLKATGHDLTETAAKEASCTAEGNTKYYTCKTCGKYFADDKGENEIAENSWVTEKTDHVFASTEWSRDAEKHWHECANGCGTRSAEAAHTFEDGICTVCGAADPSYVKPDSPDTSDRALLSGMVLLTVLSGATGFSLVSRRKKNR